MATKVQRSTPATMCRQRSGDIVKPSAMRKQLSGERVAGARHRAAVRAREAVKSRNVASASKYPRHDVIMIKQVFDSYDADGSGFIDQFELLKVLQKEKERAQHFDPLHKKSLDDRQAQNGRVLGQDTDTRGVFLVDFADSLHRAMDANGDGHISFEELLRLLYPYATEGELRTMAGWVSYEAAQPLALHHFTMTVEQRTEVRSMFRRYDVDGDGTISAVEFRKAMERCGVGVEEADEFFAQADRDANRRIDLEEFTEFMRAFFHNGDSLTTEMLYAPI